MTKRSKEQPIHQPQVTKSHSANAALHLPTKQPTLLAVSIVLFALWFVFLLVTAILG